MIAAQLAVGQIWSAKYVDRRVRIVRVRTCGRLALAPVVKLGDTWQPKKGALSSTCDAAYFVVHYRLLEGAQ